MDYFLRCTVNGILDFGALRSQYLALVDIVSQENPDLGWVASKYSCRTLYWAGESEGALEAYRGILEFAPSEAESLLVEIDIAHLEGDIEGAHGDSYGGSAKKIAALEKKYFEALDRDTKEATGVIPSSPLLIRAYPNPFNNAVALNFAIPERGTVSIRIFDQQGRLINTLLDAERNAGTQSVIWNAAGIPSGQYWCQFTTLSGKASVRLILVR